MFKNETSLVMLVSLTARKSCFLSLLILAPVSLASQPVALAFGFFGQEPYSLSCSFTSGEFTNLGVTSPNVPKWSFDVRIDKRNKSVLYRGSQLVDGKFGAGHVQFFFKAMGDNHKMLLDLNKLTFVATYSDDVSSLVRKGKCKKI